MLIVPRVGFRGYRWGEGVGVAPRASPTSESLRTISSKRQHVTRFLTSILFAPSSKMLNCVALYFVLVKKFDCKVLYLLP